MTCTSLIRLFKGAQNVRSGLIGGLSHDIDWTDDLLALRIEKFDLQSFRKDYKNGRRYDG